jgi:Kef-type K+ transport system membrane component KefB
MTNEFARSAVAATNHLAEVIHHLSENAVDHSPHGMTHMMMHLMLQLAVIIIAAKAGGYFFQRVLKMPSVLGELVSGMIIGPYALGGLIPIPGLGALFSEVTIAGTPFAASIQLNGIATIASIVLLFLAGLETDLVTFMRYSVVGSLVGLGGLVTAFVLGDLCAVWFYPGIDHFMDPTALFLGVISVATSVGITARILAEKKKMASPEGVTILAGAVFDDVFGIITLAIVTGLANAGAKGGDVNWGQIGMIALKAVGVFALATTIGLRFAPRLTSLLKQSKSKEIIVACCFGVALLISGLMEMAGLAMIIGAYITGLALSRTDLVHEIEEHLQGINNLLVPIFFCVMGMMVNFEKIANPTVLTFGAIYSLLAIFAKVGGCALPAYCCGFNLRGSLRIGLGMLPRGEVALIVAGVGLANGVIDQSIFGVSILMTMITTMLAPPLLVKSFEGKSGLRRAIGAGSDEVESIELEFPSQDITEFLTNRMVRALKREEFFVHSLHTDTPTYAVRKDDIGFTMMEEDGKLVLHVPKEYKHIASMILLEELLSLTDLLDASEKMGDLKNMGNDLMAGLFI